MSRGRRPIHAPVPSIRQHAHRSSLYLASEETFLMQVEKDRWTSIGWINPQISSRVSRKRRRLVRSSKEFFNGLNKERAYLPGKERLPRQWRT